MNSQKEGYLLRIFVGESDRKDGVPLYEWLVQQAKNKKLLGATVLRGIESYGDHSSIHTAKILDLSSDLPVIIEIIDTIEKIESFMPILDTVMHGGLATLEKVQIRMYKAKQP